MIHSAPYRSSGLAALALGVALSVTPLELAQAQAPAQPPAPAAAPENAQPAPAPATSVAARPAATPPAPARAVAATDGANESTGIDSLRHSLEPKANGLTEAEVVEAALTTSPTLRKAELDSDKASANHARAKLAIFPRIDLSARYTHLSRVAQPSFGAIAAPSMDANGDGQVDFVPPDPNAPGVTFPQVLDQFANQASLRIPITDLFLVILPTYRGTKMLRDVADHQQRAKESSVAYDARLAFYDLIRAQGIAVVAADSARVLEHHVKDLEALAAAGAATETDVLRAHARLSGAQVTVSQFNGNVEVASMRLSRLVGSDVDLKRGVAEPVIDFDPGETPQAGDLLTKAFANRQELQALRALQRAREKLASARRGAQWPQLSATGNAYYSSPNPRIFPQKEEFRASWDVGVALTFSPNDLMIARTQASDAEMDLEQVAQDMRLLEDAIAVEAALAVTSHRTSRERIAATTQNLEASLRFFDDQQNLMKAGAATPSDVLDAEAELRRAQLEWVDAYIQARMAKAALIKAGGDTGLPRGRGPRSSQ